MRQPSCSEQSDQLLKIGGRQVAKLLPMTFAQRLRHGFQQSESSGSDGHADDAPIAGGALAGNQAALFEFIQHAGDVRGSRHQPVGQSQRWLRRRMLGAEQPKDVILLRRQIKSTEKSIFVRTQTIVGAPKIQENFLLERIEVQLVTLLRTR